LWAIPLLEPQPDSFSKATFPPDRRDKQGISHFGGLIEGRMVNQDRSALNAAAWDSKNG
jgi:hypothetical protein